MIRSIVLHPVYSTNAKILRFSSFEVVYVLLQLGF